MNLVDLAIKSYGVNRDELWLTFKPYSKINLKKKRNLKKFKKNPMDYLGPITSGLWIGIMVAKYIKEQKAKKGS